GSIAQSVQSEARVQGEHVTATAQANLEAYRRQLVDQERAEEQTLDRALGERATREYRARSDELARKESDYALQLASADSAQRLSLRTKLSNLALDDATRAQVTAQLAALDRKESDAVAAMKNRDQMTLAALDAQLHAQVRTQLAQQVGTLRTRTVAKLNARTLQTRSEIVGQVGIPAVGGVALPANAGPDLRLKLRSLHERFQHDFNRDATQTIAQFQKTRADLTQRFQALAGADSADQRSANRQIGALQKQRGELYGQMVAQIDREVKVIAQKRGIAVVVSNEVAPAGGVDLTPEAQKEIESLH
ncbi:MAG: OmpH family outer membrane protein, partial [Candidatus Eremiobacteraeota bacterium]|nr:OmpH family outer membrane protein [Candidatus Eremiobacteraeota bacterium]